MTYFVEVAASVSQLLNAILGGNRDQTLSSRAYEAAVLENLLYWKPAYYAINGFWRLLKNGLVRLGFSHAAAMPENHCEDAFFGPGHDTETTYHVTTEAIRLPAEIVRVGKNNLKYGHEYDLAIVAELNDRSVELKALTEPSGGLKYGQAAAIIQNYKAEGRLARWVRRNPDGTVKRESV